MSDSSRKRKRSDDAIESGADKVSPATTAALVDAASTAATTTATTSTTSAIPAGEHPSSRRCPYLDTIDRKVLDFDFEKLCSVSLSKINVYACLVCGKYFQGRGQHTHAYTHSVDASHHVFINLSTLQTYCLPDNYLVIDASLDDIRHVLCPLYTPEQVRQIMHIDKPVRALNGVMYLPGTVGLNNIKANDYMNVVLQALVHVAPFRDFFLQPGNYTPKEATTTPALAPSAVLQRTGELIRKMCNSHVFKPHVSPHELLQAVTQASDKEFLITKQGDPLRFVAWFLNTLHHDLVKPTKALTRSRTTAIHSIFQGNMSVWTRIVESDLSEGADETHRASPFLYLSLDVPNAPLFSDATERSFIPQAPLPQLLDKFNGIHTTEYRTGQNVSVKRFLITRLPSYLILVINRFKKNNFFLEKNPTIVNFPVQGLDMAAYCTPGMSQTTYDLVANICHEGKPGSGEGVFRVHVAHETFSVPATPDTPSVRSQAWYLVEDLHVSEILPQMIALSEAYIQVYRRNV